MVDIAKIFIDGDDQAVMLPEQYHFDTTEVWIRRDPTTGDIILSPRPMDWEGFFALRDLAEIPEDFLCDRNDPQQQSEPL